MDVPVKRIASVIALCFYFLGCSTQPPSLEVAESFVHYIDNEEYEYAYLLLDAEVQNSYPFMQFVSAMAEYRNGVGRIQSYAVSSLKKRELFGKEEIILSFRIKGIRGSDYFVLVKAVDGAVHGFGYEPFVDQINIHVEDENRVPVLAESVREYVDIGRQSSKVGSACIIKVEANEMSVTREIVHSFQKGKFDTLSIVSPSILKFLKTNGLQEPLYHGSIVANTMNDVRLHFYNFKGKKGNPGVLILFSRQSSIFQMQIWEFSVKAAFIPFSLREISELNLDTCLRPR